MEGIFITTATGKALEDQISLMDKLTNEWTMRAARGECAWVCSDCCMSFPDGMPDACAHHIQQCTNIIARDKTDAYKQGENHDGRPNHYRMAPICTDAGRLQGTEQVVGKTCLRHLLEAQSEGKKP